MTVASSGSVDGFQEFLQLNNWDDNNGDVVKVEDGDDDDGDAAVTTTTQPEGESATTTTVRLRPTAASRDNAATATTSHDAEAQDGLGNNHSDNNTNSNIAGDDDNDNDDNTKEELEDLDESDPEPLQLPESTHTLLYTRPILSIPFLFAMCIVFISVACLVMALSYNLKQGSPGNPLGVPANVASEVRAAAYLSIFIALLMEEEIPTALYLLKIIPRPSFKKRFPSKSYKMFVASAVLRIILGYLFLANVFIILAQTDDVLDIFFNVLALQFISELDDIAFELAKMDVLGRRMRRACTAKLFQTQFEKQQFKRSKRASIFLKSVYFINLLCFIVGSVIITLKQIAGEYQCDTIKVDFGDTVWKEAVVVNPETGEYEEDRMLVFSTFNGVYRKNGTHAGRPVYQEARKFDGKEYDEGMVVPAEIKYDEDMEAWVLAHPHIKQSTDDDEDGWLLRSPDTDEYDLLGVDGDWNIWIGVISYTRVSYSCNSCSSKQDCNLNGKCVHNGGDGACKCATNRKGVNYMGTHCEVKLKDSCQVIEADVAGAAKYKFSIEILSNETENEGKMFEQYNRPVYTHLEFPGAKEDDYNWIVYTGRRWIYFGFNPRENNQTMDDIRRVTRNYHAFWSPYYSFSTGSIFLLSEPTTGDTPVGVDWHNVTERNVGSSNQFGPFGALSPMQKNGQAGRGFFRCVGSIAQEENRNL